MDKDNRQKNSGAPFHARPKPVRSGKPADRNAGPRPAFGGSGQERGPVSGNGSRFVKKLLRI